jgi:hypothetical protein
MWRKSIWVEARAGRGAIEGDGRVDDEGELVAVVDEEERCRGRGRKGGEWQRINGRWATGPRCDGGLFMSHDWLGLSKMVGG